MYKYVYIRVVYITKYRYTNMKICISHTTTGCRWHSNYVQSLFDRPYFYKMKVVVKFFRWGAQLPHAPLAGAAPQTPRFCSGIESLMGNQTVYKI